MSLIFPLQEAIAITSSGSLILKYGQPGDAGVFEVEQGRATKISFEPKARVASIDAFAVSLERKGGVPKAETRMVLVGK
ncbi:MAG: hypothetical protein H0X73_05175 [Chthoniobacterales bacterium]|nr:hypothetical protein [Chthoniobacterales bacterium]